MCIRCGIFHGQFMFHVASWYSINICNGFFKNATMFMSDPSKMHLHFGKSDMYLMTFLRSPSNTTL